ncbi:MAG: LLM class flavin-dependent oxidoreductase [Actinomycetota bacterium]
MLPQHEVSGDLMLDAARLAEDAGLDSVWLIDHLIGRPKVVGGPARPILECWTALSAVGAATSRVSVGTLVLRVGLRRPRVLASMAATLANICSNRLIIGLGIGDETNAYEHSALGLGFKTRSDRLVDLDQTIESLTTVAPQVPLWIGGGSEALMRRAATVAGWNWWGSAEQMQERLDRFRDISAGSALVSWAGHWPGVKALENLAAMGVDHVIVSTGSVNFRERIAALSACAGYPPGV